MSSHRLPTVQASARYKSAHVLKHAVQSKVHGPRKVPSKSMVPEKFLTSNRRGGGAPMTRGMHAPA